MLPQPKTVIASLLLLAETGKAWKFSVFQSTDCTNKNTTIVLRSAGNIGCSEFDPEIDFDSISFSDLGECRIKFATSKDNCKKGDFVNSYKSCVQNGCFPYIDSWAWFAVDGCSAEKKRAVQTQYITG